MEKQREQDRADLEMKRLCGVFGSPQPPEEEKPLDKVKEPPRPYRGLSFLEPPAPGAPGPPAGRP